MSTQSEWLTATEAASYGNQPGKIPARALLSSHVCITSLGMRFANRVALASATILDTAALAELQPQLLYCSYRSTIRSASARVAR